MISKDFWEKRERHQQRMFRLHMFAVILAFIVVAIRIFNACCR